MLSVTYDEIQENKLLVEKRKNFNSIQELNAFIRSLNGKVKTKPILSLDSSNDVKFIFERQR